MSTHLRPFSELPPVEDAVYRSCKYMDDLLTVQIEHYDKGSIEIFIPSHRFIIAPDKNCSTDDIMRHGVRLQISQPIDHLHIQNNHFVPPQNFESLMHDAKIGRHLCYGLKADKGIYLLNLIGYECWISCVCYDIEQISWCVMI